MTARVRAWQIVEVAIDAFGSKRRRGKKKKKPGLVTEASRKLEPAAGEIITVGGQGEEGTVQVAWM